jgi:hypothetical protein
MERVLDNILTCLEYIEQGSASPDMGAYQPQFGIGDTATNVIAKYIGNRTILLEASRRTTLYSNNNTRITYSYCTIIAKAPTLVI